MDLFLNQKVNYNDEAFIISAFCNDKKELSMKYDDLDFYWVLLYNKECKTQIIVNCNLIYPITEDSSDSSGHIRDVLDSAY